MTRNATRNPVSFGERLKEAQSERSLKNEDAALEIGVSLRLYQMWRAGQRPGMDNLIRLARFYEKPVGWFLGEETAA